MSPYRPQRGDWKTLGCAYQFFVISVGSVLLLVVLYILLVIVTSFT